MLRAFALARANARLDARRRPPKIPRNAARRAGSVHSPVQVERFLGNALARMVSKFATAVKRIVLPKVDDLAKWSEEHHDAKSDAAPLIAAMRSAASRSFKKQAVRAVCEQAARRVVAHSKGSFNRLGIKVKKEPDLVWLLNGWAKDQADRVQGMAKEQVDKLAAILGTAGARHAKSVSRDIHEALGVTESRADFIARDSISSLNSKISRHRFKAANISKYIWTSMQDANVREAHADLDSEVFDVDGDGDPEEGHPGEPYGCRCVQAPCDPDDQDDEAESEDDSD